MKGIRLFLTACFAFIGIQCAYADDDATARAATRRSATTTVVSNRGQSGATSVSSRTNATSGISRATTRQPNNDTSQNVRERTTTARTGVVIRDSGARTATENSSQTVSARTTSTVMPRAAVNKSNVISVPSVSSARTATTNATRTGIRTGATTTSNPRGNGATSTISRVATATRNISAPKTSSTARSATSGARVSRAAITAEEIMNRDYTTCRDVFYDCMDEFCANKDSQLKRCACSARVNEFDDVKAQLAEVEDKLLDFSQRLLTVNMDKEDAAAIYQETEGEIAFNQDDTSDSKKLLDEIANKLNTTFDTSSFDANLAPISLSLDTDAAFDSLDSLSGTSTTAKSGTDLYNAALPVCREMAMEVCTANDLSIAESGYQMLIEQDCNTVAKAYQTQQNQAREQILESSALLDMSRLDDYQTRNSDDILTCKRKMLDMLSSTSVCGENLGKCLDISGQYIDPSTGEAILTSNLVNLGNLITRPSDNQTWTSAPGNEKFVSYLNSKKMFLESATENCEDIADTVWDQFIDDALAQIKLAQEAKLEEVRQSCTTLTAQCLSDAAESLEDFDARALSIFGVAADKTVKQMCAEVQASCTALLDTVDGGTDWSSGMTEIANDKTYETILQTCREVGRNCIIQSCKSISGNFGLCENIQTSVNRKSIINRTACWNEVYNCVASAGTDAIDQITAQLVANSIIDDNGTFYNNVYGITPNDEYVTTGPTQDEIATICITADETNSKNCIYDICHNECNGQENSSQCQICRIAERIWGNCETHPTVNLTEENSHNKIKMPSKNADDTLLSWFAKNTNTQDAVDSCRDTSCGPGYVPRILNNNTTICVSEESMSYENWICPVPPFERTAPINPDDPNSTNCCAAVEGDEDTIGFLETNGLCCINGSKETITGLDWGTNRAYFSKDKTSMPTNGLCMPNSKNITFVAAYPDGDTFTYILCIGGDVTNGDDDETPGFPNGQTVKCSGNYVLVSRSGKYSTPEYETTNHNAYPTNFYRTANGDECEQNPDGTWPNTPQCNITDPATWIINWE